MTYLSLRSDPALLVSALVICLVAAVGVFRIRSRMRNTRGMVRGAWLFLCGVEAAAGIWGAHMIADLAYDPGVGDGYEPLGVLGALLLAVAGSSLAFSMAWTGRERVRQMTGGVLLALTIAGTQYAGLAAWRTQAVLHWEPAVVWVSVVLGMALCIGAVMLAGPAKRLRDQLLGAALFAAAVASIHMIGLSGATFTPAAAALPPELLDRTALLFAAYLISGLMILGGLGAAYIDDQSSSQALARMQRLANATREGIAVLGENRRILDCNAAFAGLCGGKPAQLVGRELGDLLELDGDAEPRLDLRQEGVLISPDGARIPVAVTLHFVAEQGEDGRPRLIATFTDLREQRAAEAHIRFLNEHDALTGLPNRSVLVSQLQTAVQRVHAGGVENLVLLCVRVTNSQEINTLHGHIAGDALLAKVGERLKRFAVDGCGAARLGGNEFALFVFGPRAADEARAAELFFAKVVQTLRRPIVWNAHVLEPQVKIGVAAVPQDSATADELMVHAESALQADDADRVEGVSYFRRELHDARNAQRALAHDLRTAIAEDQLTVFYQPQARSEDGVLCGFEALVRWTHPQRGFLPPDQFISVAEESGLIGALGEWVLRRACLDAMTWPKPVPVAVNLSPLQVSETGLPTRVHEILIETGLPPSRLELEITESALFGDYQRALDTLRRLKALGVRIAMDDFGTGFSSLSTLQSFPFDKIKIDKSFVEGVGKLERSTVIVKAVLGIGRGLAIPVVAEGVETAEQMAFLREEMCAVIQGYHIGRPGPVELHQALFDAAPAPVRPLRAAAAA